MPEPGAASSPAASPRSPGEEAGLAPVSEGLSLPPKLPFLFLARSFITTMCVRICPEPAHGGPDQYPSLSYKFFTISRTGFPLRLIAGDGASFRRVRVLWPWIQSGAGR
ncbi:hypothetical protein NITHO_1660010 [Nitrolancea hollandica Lb]|uniref:Uncharacterized protein n=1 Tax=Nitrolancea hollandica Lb TaxID=1129897 RepID=I4EE05_9BACT|nr:hypothetical protein NITHO_1660010 [Nitrolancea hollandica Lb]